MITEEIKKQWNMPIIDFQKKVKCCYNCPNRMQNISTMNIEGYNNCFKCASIITNWDYCCDKYCGNAKEENLIKDLTNEEREILDRGEV